ncbi:MAG: hypothetical protein LBU32_07620 [Clostridiales bacterium]|nr:hypothetical protein [Clostridiales bacterium]
MSAQQAQILCHAGKVEDAEQFGRAWATQKRTKTNLKGPIEAWPQAKN